MFKLNFKIALRNLWRHKTSSIINILGLAIGLTSCLMLMLYVSYEWNFDNQIRHASRVYQVMTNMKDMEGNFTNTGDATGNMIAKIIKEEISNIEATARIGYGGESLLTHDKNSFKRDAKFVDPDIIKIYDYKFIEGNAATALSAPKSVVLTRKTAKLLFGEASALNKSVRYNDMVDMTVTGVVEDRPSNSSNRFDFLMPWSFYEMLYEWVKYPSWTNFNWQTLVLVNQEADIALINGKVKGMIEKNQPEAYAESFLFPLTDKHLYGEFKNGKSIGGEIERVYLFLALAIGILLIACVNFMNMATAKSERRAKEVGIKKTIGASRGSLISQFLMESMVLTLISVILAIALLEILLPTFNGLLSIELSISYFSPVYWVAVLAIVLLTGFLSGSYPALYLSSFDPVKMLKRKTTRARRIPVNLRQVLVVGQFAFATILIVGTLVIYQQVQFIKDRPVGYDIDLLVELPQDGQLSRKFDTYKAELLKSGAVTSICQSSASISRDGSNFWNFEWPGATEKDKQIVFNQIATTYDFIKTNGIELVAGRDFSKDYASDTAGVLVSSAAAKIMGLKDPVGTKVKYHGEDATIVGVFKDFIWGSPYYTDRPMVVAFNPGWNGNITMRLNPEVALAESIDRITKVTRQINPSYPVDLKFVNALYADKLQKEKILGTLSNLFGGLAIFISCLGLFGLAAFSAEQRTKEFGVRKVLGASVLNIVQLLSLSFMKMILISIIIGLPIAYMAMSKWLEGFEFRTPISLWILLATVFGTSLIAFLTVSFQAVKAAKTNPVDALKYE